VPVSVGAVIRGGRQFGDPEESARRTGRGLVISSLTRVVVTRSKLTADGWPLAVAHVTLWCAAGTNAWPFQYVTVTTPAG